MTRSQSRIQDLVAGTRALPRVRGSSWREGGRGELFVGTARADLSIEGDRLRATLALREPNSARTLLARSAAWLANIRAAARPGGFVLLADGWLEDERVAALSLREIRSGLAEACGATPSPTASTRTFDASPLTAALRERGERVVELDGGLELFPRIDGHPVPVRTTVNGRGLLFSRPLVRVERDDLEDPLAHLALRLNARLRFARLVERDGHMHAEARLAARLAGLDRVLVSARAVALAAEHARIHLEIFARDPRAAHAYARVFLPETFTRGESR